LIASKLNPSHSAFVHKRKPVAQTAANNTEKFTNQRLQRARKRHHHQNHSEEANALSVWMVTPSQATVGTVCAKNLVVLEVLGVTCGSFEVVRSSVQLGDR
jgi:hypothetical protein